METIGREGRSSKKLITNKQSMHAVEYNDDLLIEILLRLPVISLLLFKTVCKRWLSLISNPSFGLRRNQIPTFDPPCGLLLRAWFGETYDFLSLDTRSPYKQSALKTTPFTFRSELQHVYILQSSNGLLLCRGGIKINYKYYVYNPCTNFFKMLPQCSNKSIYQTKIAFDPTKSPHYKVIQTVLVNEDDVYDGVLKIQIQTYSSETRNWSFCNDQYTRYNFDYFDNGIYWNDAIYWVNRSFKPNVIFKLDINVAHQALTTISTFGLLDSKVSSTHDGMLFESRGCLLLLILCDYQYSRRINVYETRNGLSGLSIQYSVNLDDITRPFPRYWSLYSNVWSIVLGESEEDSFLLIELKGKLVQYKPVLKTSRELCEFASVDPTSDIFHFIASFASVGV